ncbi:carbohydrate esterase family 16 protein [Sphaerobolus stellatus SS14]|uniref:Unplaced genomic scaffold SPHSTscaffold_146, whole genome shotgun sequence n=1 Tax=Sphaerobolus stellatus (strain SS14) TaxID=990650 RepID=A0A0C9V603_SPHS4|nr:carbohydrate esterase family 16 protein [Sphaerobolus stellatus SS14]
MFPVASLVIFGLQLLPASAKSPFDLKFKNLVAFGDSYTDISVASYPLWPIWAADYAKLDKTLVLAKAGATCDQTLTPRVWPAVVQDEIPTYLNATNNGKSLKAEETLYTLWIGTNDLGVGELITGQANPGVTVVDTTTCAVNWVDRLYKTGARNFLFQNMIPLDKVPLYQADSYPNRYWTEPRNTTAWNVQMKELVASGNALSDLLLANVATSLPHASICRFDSHGLFTDILAHPNLYLNGTVAQNTTGASNACVFQLNESTNDSGDCTVVTGSAADSYIWFDELHPTVQGQRIVAREIVKAVQGTSNRWLKCF